MTDDVQRWIEERLYAETSAEPDGYQDVKSNVWYSRNHLRRDSAAAAVPHSKEAVDLAIDTLVDDGELLRWHGLLTPTSPDHLRAVIESERQAGITRKLLVGKINRLLEEQATEVSA